MKIRTTLVAAAASIGLMGAFATAAQAVTNPTVNDACGDARDGVNAAGFTIPEFANPTHNDPYAQATFIEAQRGRTNPDANGNNNLSGIVYSTTQGSSANCRIIYTARNGFLVPDHVDIYYSINFTYDPTYGYLATAFWTTARTCTTDVPSAGTPFSCPL